MRNMTRTIITTIPLGMILLSVSFSARALDLPALVDNCAACHGVQGVATDPAYPHLAGQKYLYMVEQTLAFRDGARTSALMSPPVQNLSDEEIEAVSKYYAERTPARGTVVDEVHQAGKNVRAYCVSCHGMDGVTVNGEWPNLKGQHIDYLYEQLVNYRNGTRVDPVMNVIARELSEQQLKDVAVFYGQQVVP